MNLKSISACTTRPATHKLFASTALITSSSFSAAGIALFSRLAFWTIGKGTKLGFRPAPAPPEKKPDFQRVSVRSLSWRVLLFLGCFPYNLIVQTKTPEIVLPKVHIN